MKKRKSIFLGGVAVLTLSSCAFLDQFSTEESSSSSSEELTSIEVSIEEPKQMVTVTFYDYDGRVLLTKDIEKGSDVLYEGETPSRPSGGKFEYTFVGWDRSLENIRSSTSFYPLFEEKLCKYVAQFFDGDTLLSQQSVTFGEFAEYSGSLSSLTKNENGKRYVFVGWDKDPTLLHVTEDVSFFAQYVETDADLLFAPHYDELGKRDGVSLVRYNGSASEVNIPEVYEGEEVVSIGLGAFSDCVSLEHVSCPKTLLSIQDQAFHNCPLLSQIELSEALVSIGSEAFAGCLSLETIVFKGSLIHLGSRAFADSGVYKIALPKNVISLGEGAFSNCPKLSSVDLSRCEELPLSEGLFSNDPSLKEIVFNNATEEIPDYFLAYCNSIEHLDLPNRLKKIGMEAFYCCVNLKDINIPEYVNEIKSRAFYGCEELNRVTFASSLETLGDEVFAYDSSLISLSLPENVRYIGNRAFANSALASLKVGDSIRFLGEGFIDETPLYDDETYLLSNIYYLISNSGDSYYIYRQKEAPFSRLSPRTKTLADNVYFAQSTISVPASLCEDLTFLRRASFVSLVLEDESNYTVKEGCIYQGDKLFRCFSTTSAIINLQPGTKTIGKEAFVNRTELENVNLNEGLEAISESAFASSSVYTLSLPSSIKTVSRRVFGGYKSGYILYDSDTTRVTFTDAQYDDLLSIYDHYKGIAGKEKGLRYFVNDEKAVAYRYSRRDTIVEFPESLGGYALNELAPYFVFENSDVIDELKLPDGIEKIGEYAMVNVGNSQMSKLTIPSSLRTLGSNAIALGRAEAVLPNKVNSIASQAIFGNGGKLFCEALSKPSYYPNDFAVGVTIYWYSDTPNTDGRHWHYTGNKTPTIWSE